MRYHLSRLRTGPQFTAVLDCLFELRPKRTDPAFAELSIIDGRLVFARREGETAFDTYVGRRDELAINLVGFVSHLRLGTAEREYVLARLDGIAARRRTP